MLDRTTGVNSVRNKSLNPETASLGSSINRTTASATPKTEAITITTFISAPLSFFSFLPLSSSMSVKPDFSAESIIAL